MADEHDDGGGFVIAEMEGTAGFQAFWNAGGGVSILQKIEGQEAVVVLSVAEVKTLVRGLAEAVGYYLQKIEGVPDVE
jgi:hypothetical protein